MAPPRPPPELNDDAVREILLYLPPDDPAHLVRASLVSKHWRRILTDQGFLRRYRRFHRTPPLLGFFHDVSNFDADPGFVPTTTTAAAASPFLPTTGLDRGSWAFDCRHGRVLLQPMGTGNGGFIVWDPVTGDKVELDEPGIPCQHFSASVLCSQGGCDDDHLHCAGGPFTVVFVCSDARGVQRACIYSSKTGAWSAPASVKASLYSSVEPNRGALVGDKIFFTLSQGEEILKYDLGKQRLSLIDPPALYRYRLNTVLMGSKIGLLGLAGIMNSEVHLWHKKVEPEEVAGWVHWGIIELEIFISTSYLCSRARVIGFAEDVGALFIKINASVYIIELRSREMTKVCKNADYNTVLPFTSFYTPGCANREL
ncbi:hypothetical protein QOZ80_7BG0585250 [Eleusine coracana subsp. coracana]|nr:hypothetical protein QOZ80_7BG0585250 [Eleusine coracana subsp. coracana]